MTKQQRQMKARIQRAVTGLQIPLMRICELHDKLEQGVKAGLDDFQLVTLARQFLAETLAKS